jgi:eukaryotic-like serine/threonine-protein kinase
MPMKPIDLHPRMPIGTIIADRYEVTGFLGRGGMGFVVAARHRELGEQVAIKFLNRSELAERFFREARAAAAIENDHVVRIYDAGRLASGEPYIVMEHLSGEDLAARLHRTGSLAPETVATILVDVCLALAEAHAAGIVHRDLKPENIFLARRPGGDEVVKLLDFGVAKVPDAGALTQTDNLLGTPTYMSPEQLLGSRDVDHRSDIWSLGIILYELLTDELPFEGESFFHLGILIREKPTPRVRRARADIPEELDAIIARCLAKQRTDRYADVGELAEALAPFLPAGMAPEIARIRRIVDEGRRRTAALAPTITPEPSEPGSALDAQLAREESRFESGSRKPTAQSVVLDSVALDSPATSRPSQDGKRRRLALLASLCLAGVAAIAIARRSHPAPSATVGTGDAPASAAIASAPGQTADAGVAIASPETASAPPGATITEAACTTRTSSPSVTGVRSASHSRSPSAGASTRTNVTLNCNPPFTIDENGFRRAKRACL